ncbi:unnamed protein product [Linum tenue]|uniref:Auxin-responsive protein n=1 Tax=Linum tenue TaxID=586396 RepID=A0AAV0P3L3_9ROSI|nr:unnamed protein product [Linum tenue]
MASCDLNLRATDLCLGLPGAGKLQAPDFVDAPTTKASGKRGFSETVDLKLNLHSNNKLDGHDADNNNHLDTNESAAKSAAATKPPAKAQVVGWPPVRSYRRNVMAITTHKSSGEEDGKKKKMTMTSSASPAAAAAALVKVCMDGAPYLRKVDLKMYSSYQQLSDALAKMFSSFTMGNYGAEGMIDFMNERKLMDLLNSSEYVPSYEDKDGDWMLVGDVPWEYVSKSLIPTSITSVPVH